ncbi:hypothetical protein JC525_16070 [Alteromonas sp. IB21]|nr:hypothetical protein [Alteromonas sp. IB21]MBJ2130448.1 hypothetical protein [Alteromonas sp. IB21]
MSHNSNPIIRRNLLLVILLLPNFDLNEGKHPPSTDKLNNHSYGTTA